MGSCTYVRFALALLLVILCAGQVGAQAGVRFLAVGDAPYSDSERRLLDILLTRELPRGTSFLVHVGDIKAGSTPCTDHALTRIADLFQAMPAPVVYTPGDNEWTDCRRQAAGAYDPRERLAFLRRLFYADPGTLRLSRLGVKGTHEGYPENYWFLYQDVLFATVHVVGSHNNLVSGDSAALAEYGARTVANRQHLSRVAEAANGAGVKALVLLFHADAGLERDVPPPAYRSFRRALDRLLEDFDGPVLAIHGDTHRYRFDHPLQDPYTGKPMTRFSRLEVPGSPVVGGVWVSIETASRDPFHVEPVYPVARDALTNE